MEPIFDQQADDALTASYGDNQENRTPQDMPSFGSIYKRAAAIVADRYQLLLALLVAPLLMRMLARPLSALLPNNSLLTAIELLLMLLVSLFDLWSFLAFLYALQLGTAQTSPQAALKSSFRYILPFAKLQLGSTLIFARSICALVLPFFPVYARLFMADYALWGCLQMLISTAKLLNRSIFHRFIVKYNRYSPQNRQNMTSIDQLLVTIIIWRQPHYTVT